MLSGAAGRRAAAVKDDGVSIERWQADTILRKENEVEAGPIGSLFNSIIELLGLVLIDVKTRPVMFRYLQSLESSSAALFFWGTDLGVSRGELDEVLRDSTQLRDTCLLVLISIGQFLASSFVPLLCSKNRQKEIVGSTDIMSSLEQAKNILDQQQYPAFETEQDKEASCRTLRVKIDTLVMLGPSLASPAEESFYDEEPRAIEHVEEHLPEQAYINSVSQKFPLAASSVVTHLGKLNWERYNHMLRLQRNTVPQELEGTVMEKAKTIFHDSALGSSMPTQSEAGLNTKSVPSRPQSDYAPSMVSSRAEASHRRLPHLPPQARSGQPFICAICNKQVRYQRTKAWKKHIFGDILAYACLFPECSIANVFFEDQNAMMSHLEQHHGLDVSISNITCPLCLDYTSSDRDALSLHFARHMEEMALAILPSGVDSDDDSGEETPSEAEDQIEKSTSLDGKVAGESASEDDSATRLAQKSGHASDAASFGDVYDNPSSLTDVFELHSGQTGKNTNNYASSTKELNDDPKENLLSPISPSKPSSTQRSYAKRTIKLPLRASNHLRDWLRANQHNPYPNAETKRALARQCNISENQVTTWFTNTRARKLAPPPLRSYPSSDEEDEITRCVCGHEESPGPPPRVSESSSTSMEPDGGILSLFIRCNVCKVRQHCGCVGIFNEATLPKEYFCEVCRQDLHKVTITSDSRKYSQYLPVTDPMVQKSEEKARSKSALFWFWTIPELEDFESNLALFGTDWEAFAKHIGKTKSLVRNQYFRLVKEGRTELEAVAKNADRLHQLTREGREKDTRLRQLELAVIALQSKVCGHQKPGLELDGKTEVQREHSDRPQNSAPEPFDERQLKTLQQLLKEGEEKDSRIQQLEQAILALQRQRFRSPSPPLKPTPHPKSGTHYVDQMSSLGEKGDGDVPEDAISLRPYKCNGKGCEKHKGFAYSDGLLRHEREVHNMHGGNKKTIYCPISDCKRSKGRGFTRKENLVEHIRRVHRLGSPKLDDEIGVEPDDMGIYGG